MALKPSPTQVALVDELIGGATESGKFDCFEKETLEDFRTQLKQYSET